MQKGLLEDTTPSQLAASGVISPEVPLKAIPPQTRNPSHRSKSAATLEASKPKSRLLNSICGRLGWLGTAALALASIPAVAEPAKVTQGKAAELGVMSVSLKDAVKLNYGLQGQLQGAGTPNEAGIGGFLPLRVGTQSVTF